MIVDNGGTVNLVDSSGDRVETPTGGAGATETALQAPDEQRMGGGWPALESRISWRATSTSPHNTVAK